MPRKTLDWLPATGPMDNRSIPSLMPPESYRLLKNVWVPSANTLARRFGWEKLFSTETDYNNADLHDQLLSLQTYYDVADASVDPTTITTWPNAACDADIQTRITGRQPVTMLHSFISTFGSRVLLAGTESRIYALNERNGNWRLLADGLGEGIDDGTCPRRRFYTSTNLDTAIFTNNFDKPIYWIFGSPPTGCDQQSARTIPDLDLIGVTKAAVTWTWKYVSFLANLEMDGKRYPNKIVWSNYQDPLSWDPSKPESIAGSADLDYGEEILGGIEVADYFFIFTTKRIWQISIKADGSFNFTHRYSPDKTGDRCLFYRNTLIATADEVYYGGKDGIYAFSIYRPMPERLQQVHLATGNIFHESRSGVISPAYCENSIAGYNSTTKEVMFSWVPNTSETGFPESTFVLNVGFGYHTSEIDHGFTAFCNHQSDPNGTVRDLLIDLCICTIADLTADGMGFVKEGLPRSVSPEDCPEYTSLYTTVSESFDGVLLEDSSEELPSEGAVCSALSQADCDKCATDSTFIGACAVDWCLKQFTAVYSRERCTNPTAVGITSGDGYSSAVATYVLDGYESRMLSLAMDFKDRRNDKTMHRMELELIPEAQEEPSTLSFRLGMSHSVVDPLDDARCGITWEIQDDKLLECQSVSVAQNALDGTRPDEGTEWPIYYESMFFYFDFTVDGTGGGFSMSRISADVQNDGVKAGW